MFLSCWEMKKKLTFSKIFMFCLCRRCCSCSFDKWQVSTHIINTNSFKLPSSFHPQQLNFHLKWVRKSLSYLNLCVEQSWVPIPIILESRNSRTQHDARGCGETKRIVDYLSPSSFALFFNVECVVQLHKFLIAHSLMS